MTYQLFHGDCLEILPTLKGASVDSIILDPPYGTETLGGGYGRRQNWDIGDGKGRVIKGDTDLSLLENSLPLAYKLAKNNTWHGVFCAPRKIHHVLSIIDASGFEYFGEVIWNKRQPGLGYSIRYAHETFLVLQKGNPEKPDNALISIIECPSDPREVKKHPHIKPLPVMKRLVSWLCPYGGVVLDYTCGVGTSGVAASQTGRNFIGIELDEHYFNLAEKRLKASQPPLFLEALPPASELKQGELTL